MTLPWLCSSASSGGGYAAVRADGGPRHEAVTELPRDAELVILATAMGGG
jgi:hypothetical protein